MLFMGTMYLKLIFTATYVLNVIGNKFNPGRGWREIYVANGTIASVGNYQIVDILLSTFNSDDKNISSWMAFHSFHKKKVSQRNYKLNFSFFIT